MLSDKVGVEWMADNGHLEHRVGPLLKTDRGQLDLFVTDTVLMQKKRPALKSIARKLTQQRWYGPCSGGKARKPYLTDIPINHAREYVNGLMRLVTMAENNPKPTYHEFCQQEGREDRQKQPPGPGSALTITLPDMHVPPPPLHPPPPPPPTPSPSHHAHHAHPSLPHVIRVLPLVCPTTPVATALTAVAERGEGGEGGKERDWYFLDHLQPCRTW
jgi:hypothetical protein